MPLVLKFSNPGVNAPHGAVASSISLWHSSRYKTLILTICAILSLSDTVSTRSAATTRSSTLLYARPAFLSIPLGSLGTVAADFEAPSSDDVDELGRSRGSQMTLLC
ncbi:hypothetical protein EMIHUDRAFT_230577 [Emiliania huxleyi CCMP1516]|uniref:Uncharacterized protein n=2 Tax=Emiliania huxleyi TaxID=2903 RepID=A0A0D3KA32_EMIH1|nr:hypothetical protein EMIHUDRAFT_230577 [Emiliania huxleyi CCMP1516]EOD32617.1 hypothetical protein EMIHUDRAFT_230577 [Emiliania huxleyi CCMP1516]|eukprot:XP_005785046.1 hypothetical protein EMIHUDRAFT_230577 [Emiliania huxleyi CCMP1516]